MDKLDFAGAIYTVEEQLDAVVYMFGISEIEVREKIANGKITLKDIKKSIIYQDLEGLPFKIKKEVYKRYCEHYDLI